MQPFASRTDVHRARLDRHCACKLSLRLDGVHKAGVDVECTVALQQGEHARFVVTSEDGLRRKQRLWPALVKGRAVET
jgi:hypothetical protein